MKYNLIIDKTKDEEVVATVHSRTDLTDKIEALVMEYSGSDRIPAYILFVKAYQAHRAVSDSHNAVHY